LPERVGELRSDEPADEIRGAAGWNGDDELNRSARVIALRARNAGVSKDKARDNE
jgi:hypothetical protein